MLISPLAIAPMIDWTYSHFRVFMRLLMPQALLYTEMQTTGAVQNNSSKALDYQAMEHPLALQLGGADGQALAACAQLAERMGYSEINLNLGCPSDRVQAGRFGACLMAEAAHVADCIRTLKAAITIPVSAKTRIGIDNQDSYQFFAEFAHQLIEAGCDKLIVHARKAWLHGLNPKQNRTIPPLHYDYVYRIKQELPHIPVVINGNINTLAAIEQHMVFADGVMLGRLACDNPYALTAIHQYFYPNSPSFARHQLMYHYIEHINLQFQQGVPLTILLKPLLNLAYGLPGCKVFKKRLLAIQQSKQLAELEQAACFLKEIEQYS